MVGKIRESALFKQIVAAANHNGATIYRNNVGCFKTNSGSWVRYGVGGMGASDLIGWTAQGRFLALEIKPPNYTPHGEKQKAHFQRQLDFIENVRKAGGVAAVVSSYEDVKALLTQPSI